MLGLSLPDLPVCDALYKALTLALPIRKVTSSFWVERIIVTTAYPIDTVTR